MSQAELIGEGTGLLQPISVKVKSSVRTGRYQILDK